jgi:hypothetical protein
VEAVTLMLFEVLSVLLALGLAAITRLFVQACRRWEVEEDRKAMAVEALLNIHSGQREGTLARAQAEEGIRSADPDGYLSGWGRHRGPWD